MARGLKRVSPAFKSIGQTPIAKEISLDVFRVIGDWYHYAVLMLNHVVGFKSNPKWIASQLSITEIEAKMAIERLLNVGLLQQVDGTLVATEISFVSSIGSFSIDYTVSIREAFKFNIWSR